MNNYPLKYVSHINAGQSPPSAEVTDLADGLPFLQGNAEFQGSSPAAYLQCDTAPKVARAGDILLSIRAPVGALNIADKPYGIGRGLCAITPTGCDGRFLWWWLHAQHERLDSISVGTTYRAVTAEDVGFLQFPQMDISQQRRIADFLDVEIARIEKLDRLRYKSLAVLQERADTHLDQVVRGDVKRDGKKAEYAPLGLIPKSWRQGRLRSIDCDVQTGPFGSQLHTEDYIEDGWPVINPSNIRPEGLVADRRVTVNEKVRERLSRHILRRGDVVFGRRGELGRSGVVTTAQEGWVCGTGSLRVRFRENTFHPGYLHRYLSIPALRHYFRMHSVGSTMANLNSSILRGMPLLLPEFSEQVRISFACDEIEQDSQKRARLIEQQLMLLAERRTALITAAVTSQFDVSTASGRGVTE